LIANVVLFLASHASEYVCGAIWNADGGWLSGKGY
jgi:NAD(P)-dependent dehydrogenase (short-subunit alcohol dehydrogenase family)